MEAGSHTSFHSAGVCVEGIDDFCTCGCRALGFFLPSAVPCCVIIGVQTVCVLAVGLLLEATMLCSEAKIFHACFRSAVRIGNEMLKLSARVYLSVSTGHWQGSGAFPSGGLLSM